MNKSILFHDNYNIVLVKVKSTENQKETWTFFALKQYF